VSAPTPQQQIVLTELGQIITITLKSLGYTGDAVLVYEVDKECVASVRNVDDEQAEAMLTTVLTCDPENEAEMSVDLGGDLNG